MHADDINNIDRTITFTVDQVELAILNNCLNEACSEIAYGIEPADYLVHVGAEQQEICAKLSRIGAMYETLVELLSTEFPSVSLFESRASAPDDGNQDEDSTRSMRVVGFDKANGTIQVMMSHDDLQIVRSSVNVVCNSLYFWDAQLHPRIGADRWEIREKLADIDAALASFQDRS